MRDITKRRLTGIALLFLGMSILGAVFGADFLLLVAKASLVVGGAAFTLGVFVAGFSLIFGDD